MAIINKKLKLHRLLLLVLISTFALNMFNFSNKVASAPDPSSRSVGLVAEIPADPPSTAATITFPANGQTVTALPIKVSGLCTGDLLVKLFKNGVFAGSAQCSGGAYSITTDLFNGTNELIARVYDALNQAGPDSNTVTVTFTEPGFNNNAPRVALTSDFARRGANPGDTLIWPILLSGGSAPYAVSVDWGDGNNELISLSVAGKFNLTHKYNSPGVYTITIKVTDVNGNSAFLQLVGVGNGALEQANQTTAETTITRVEIPWWPLLIAGALIVISFWLGGRSKLIQLRRQAEKRIQY